MFDGLEDIARIVCTKLVGWKKKEKGRIIFRIGALL